MPTGYTHPVAEGEVTDFRTFALLCARAFGATIMMRDDSLDAPIPEAFEPSDYYSKEVARLTGELARVERLSENERKVAALAAFQEAHTAWLERREARARSRARYTNMLTYVEAWEPPSPDHVGLKTFMRQQLQESLKYDCGDEYDTAQLPSDGVAWHAAEVTRLRERLDYAKRQQLDEVERVASRNHWVRQLRASLMLEVS
jgi:hypothetical protein